MSSLSSSEQLDDSALVQLVSKSTSDRLLRKYFDATEFDFDYEQSSIWSPLVVPKRIYLTSPSNLLCSEKGNLKKSSHWLKDCINSCFSTDRVRIFTRRIIDFLLFRFKDFFLLCAKLASRMFKAMKQIMSNRATSNCRAFVSLPIDRRWLDFDIIAHDLTYNYVVVDFTTRIPIRYSGKPFKCLLHYIF
ncbi:hypothetical protein R3W88_020572 [Solanum pinnatisectum]|uniref:Uncharacterized protein n=1 Tax=Solanum pinnatisectum TaxID=50273 RepID=A0AAV9KQH8_9SOLN|nr:hypothetical protein R3W88_020572 [Solanum pinnatisectum]